ncbi:MAG: Fe-S cluster assembly sulfur transfer protein SufU [Acidobacteriota bacterium]
MSDELKSLYQEIILDHYRTPRNLEALEGARHATGHNPLCGDRVEVFLDIEDDTVQRATFRGAGCAISMAAASLMTEALKGKSLAEAREISTHFRRMVRGDDEVGDHDLGKLAALAGVRDIPIRVKCATLAWHTFEAALAEAPEPVSTETPSTETPNTEASSTLKGD